MGEEQGPRLTKEEWVAKKTVNPKSVNPQAIPAVVDALMRKK